MGNNDEGRAGSEMPEDKLILIVDDDESAWDLLYYIVRREGFRTEQASDGREALDKARVFFGRVQGLQALNFAFHDTFRHCFIFALVGSVFLILILLTDDSGKSGMKPLK